MIRIVHIITGLGSGGAENMLYKLIKYSDKSKYYHEVISLMDEGVIGEKIIDEGIKVHSINLSIKSSVNSIIEIKNICKNFEIVNTWLYHADLIGFIVSKILLQKKLIWNIRHSNLDKKANKARTLLIVKVNSILSKYVDHITYNSRKAKHTHEDIGYVNKRFSIIPNGFELDSFKFYPEERNKIRNQLNIKEYEKIIITVGRWDIQKDYYTLMDALHYVNKTSIKFKFIMVGTNLDIENKELTKLIYEKHLNDKVILLGRRNDIPKLLSAADLYVSSSMGESFSNSIGEAMAAELPCIVTDVGDSRIIVDDCGIVVKPKDWVELSNAIIEFFNTNSFSREEIGIKCRNRIYRDYRIDKIVSDYEDLYNSLIVNVFNEINP